MYIKPRSGKKFIRIAFWPDSVQGIGSKCPKFDV